jgi:transcriptional regulator of acetoin/glycerol metabolism
MEPLEDVYWTFSYSPVYDESGKAAGVFVTCNETTDKVKAGKNRMTLADNLSDKIEARQLLEDAEACG